MELPDNIDSKFRFVLLASSRAEQLMRGAPSKLASRTGKPTTMALRELRGDMVAWEMGPPPSEEPPQPEVSEEPTEELN